ncbi:HesA/MoeB/ThiF family protein [Ferruginibacter paludis]|uniref:HesA/MoeB/ThiF family protein n=1 Tax=Ferruginibacter paludis TaxID=1310417 RepID=UPI0025B51E61|nr:HesA/MoeB/ThiF family protein [Ferruginibacter paludis]MDN3654506.1 HesA/MoeB/ThiF family protein [Ferruginibacter paludis]
MNSQVYERYQRQVILPELGEQGQQNLLQAKVLVIGAGGLGCPVLQYLAAAGVGTIGIVDDDVVALSNLHRQVLYAVADIGTSKAETAARVLSGLNPDINIIAHNTRLSTDNALGLMDAFDIIVDGTDNFATRYMINDACVLLDKPLVYGAISQFEGQAAVFNYPSKKNEEKINYRDIFPHPPKEGEVLNCAEAGVLGVLPGIIGGFMANETIKMITGLGELLAGQLLIYNALNNQVYTMKLAAGNNTRSLIPGDKEAFLKTDYIWLCAAPHSELEIDVHTFNDLLANEKTATIVDVREPGEMPVVTEFATIKIPLGQLANQTDLIQSDTVLLFCQSGKRSLQAANTLAGIFGNTKKIYSLKGGIVQWKKQQQVL